MRTALAIVTVLSFVALSANLIANERVKYDYSDMNYLHSFGLFFGAQSDFDDNVNNFAFGSEYEYKLPCRGVCFGIGAQLEFVFERTMQMGTAPKFWFHPFESFSISVAPTMILQQTKEKGHLIIEPDPKKENPLMKNTFEAFHNIYQVRYATKVYLTYSINPVGTFAIEPRFGASFLEGKTYYLWGICFKASF